VVGAWNIPHCRWSFSQTIPNLFTPGIVTSTRCVTNITLHGVVSEAPFRHTDLIFNIKTWMMWIVSCYVCERSARLIKERCASLLLTEAATSVDKPREYWEDLENMLMTMLCICRTPKGTCTSNAHMKELN